MNSCSPIIILNVHYTCLLIFLLDHTHTSRFQLTLADRKSYLWSNNGYRYFLLFFPFTFGFYWCMHGIESSIKWNKITVWCEWKWCYHVSFETKVRFGFSPRHSKQSKQTCILFILLIILITRNNEMNSLPPEFLLSVLHCIKFNESNKGV